mmetsp:Transcript_8306/g.24965  ORF Transcript_8306/g.24965 Transcript_8306/m.24965 type:complete len:217 (-) Transcript_8306:1740-2390(-)
MVAFAGGWSGRRELTPRRHRMCRGGRSAVRARAGNGDVEGQLRRQMQKFRRENSELNRELEKIRQTEGLGVPDGCGDITRPRPDLNPEEAVAVQLKALQKNDFPEVDSGVATAFAFAAPMNRLSVGGSVEKFSKYVRNSIYSMLINSLNFTFGELTLTSEGRRASLPVIVTSMDGNKRKFLWNLSKRKVWEAGNFQECWLVDAVISSDPHGRLIID